MRSFLSTLVFVAVCAYSARADAPASPANSPAGAQPKIVTMKCSQAFMPISEADLAAMNSTDPTQAPAGNYSTVPTEAACKAFDDPTGGFCNPKSCVGYPVGEQCNEVIITGANSTSLSNTTVARVSCEVNYFKPAPNDADQRVLCTAQDQKIYSCKGKCAGEATCTECVSMSDPALANL
ncbi:uncharacterized protein MELLADRAFT_123438 [Melampsora larici-populina 98AG31]|uniref:Secreted protein n=1 Tax=Melampsora larici-populina (strain 98AG31 / pathotype 3-4-7) TaxID=747676 RepID=F4RKE6_MELLP|nr:uncharacterized protein MELLADRAFT_123438 [Melampsora larici-populina 98AG31]EGG07083.1 secreted protein [Melampsora larici-populina 98AG31]